MNLQLYPKVYSEHHMKLDNYANKCLLMEKLQLIKKQHTHCPVGSQMQQVHVQP